MVFGERSVLQPKPPITQIGQSCRHCQTPVVERSHPPSWKPKPGRKFYYQRWLQCPNCHAVYTTEADRVTIAPPKDQPTLNFSAKEAAANSAGSRPWLEELRKQPIPQEEIDTKYVLKIVARMLSRTTIDEATRYALEDEIIDAIKTARIKRGVNP